MSETPDWRAQRWAATHQRLYDVALELFQRDGFDAVNVGRIAREAGVSVPTFYAHYPSKEHLVLQLPTADDIEALMSSQPAGLPATERIRDALFVALAKLDSADELRWRIIAGTPTLRRRAAEFERATAELFADELFPGAAGSPRHTDTALVYAYLAAYTSGLLAWADGEGSRSVHETVGAAFDALENR